MKRLVLLMAVLVAMVCSASAQNATGVMQKVIDKYTMAKNVSADFTLASSQMNVKGNIVMDGPKFRILTDVFKTWYNGTTQWLYTTATGEVNVVEPTREELDACNPYLAVLKYDKQYRAVLKNTTAKDYVVDLVALDYYVEMTGISLTIDKVTYQIKEAVATMVDGTKQTMKLANYKMNEKLAPSTFEYDAKMVPSGTQVIDLR